MIVVAAIVILLIVLKLMHVISIPWIGVFAPLLVFLTFIFLWFYVSRKRAVKR
jgi:hypothetical protein